MCEHSINKLTNHISVKVPKVKIKVKINQRMIKCFSKNLGTSVINNQLSPNNNNGFPSITQGISIIY